MHQIECTSTQEDKVAFKIAKCYVPPQLRLYILLYLLTLEACHKSTSTMM
jgi:hypothetical protein